MSVFLLLLACTVDTGPCQDYCDYICECHAGEEGYDCEECRTVYGGADAELQDECETELLALQDADAAAGNSCEATSADTGK